MWTTVESSTLVSSMLFRTDIPMYVRTSWTVVRRTDTKFWIRRIYVERQGCLKRVLVYGPEVRRNLRKRRRSVRCPLCLPLPNVKEEEETQKPFSGPLTLLENIYYVNCQTISKTPVSFPLSLYSIFTFNIGCP